MVVYGPIKGPKNRRQWLLNMPSTCLTLFERKCWANQIERVVICLNENAWPYNENWHEIRIRVTTVIERFIRIFLMIIVYNSVDHIKVSRW